MSLETGSFIADLTPSNPPSSDPVGQGDDHIRLLKTCVQGSLPNLGAIFGQVRSQDVAASVLSSWNTNHLIVTASATTTVALTLPVAASITTGFFVNVTTLGTGSAAIIPGAGGSISTSATFFVNPQMTAHIFYEGAGRWRGVMHPNNGIGSTAIFDNVRIDGALTVSGSVQMTGNLSVNGTASISGNVVMSGVVVMNSTLVVKGAATFSAAVVLAGGVSISGATVLSGALTVGGTTTFSATVVTAGLLDATGGQIRFPATQVPSAGANVLDDYEEGTFTPTLTATTPGNLNGIFSTRVGTYTKIGRHVAAAIHVETSTWTWTTASGSLRITGLPFTSNTGGIVAAAVGRNTANTGATVGTVVMDITNGTTILEMFFNQPSTGTVSGLGVAAAPTGVNQLYLVQVDYEAS